LLFVSLAANIHTVKADSNNSSASYSVVEILSPTNSTYESKFLTSKVTFLFGGLDYTLTYSVDGKDEGAIPWVIDNPDNELHVMYKAIGTVTLPKLSDGPHCLAVTLVCGFYGRSGGNHPGAPFKPTSPGSSDYEATWTDVVYFTIDSEAINSESILTLDSVSPQVSFLSMENVIYNSTDIPLNFTVDEVFSKVVYSLDGKDNMTITGNTTLTGLSVGTHNLTVCAWDEAGNVASQTVNFAVVDVASAALEPREPNPLILGAVSVTVLAMVAVGVLGHFKRREREAKPS
jgi:hypothetical protein